MAKNTSVMAALAAREAGFSKKRTSSIGWSVCSSHDDERGRARRRRRRSADDRRVDVQPLVGRLDDRPQQRDRARRSTARRRSGRAAARRGPCEVGQRGSGRRRARRSTIGHVHEEHRAPPEVLEQEAADHRAERDADAGDARPRCRWPGARSRGSGNTLVRIDSVAGMISAPPMPMKARVTISCVGASRRSAEATEPTPKMTRPMLQRALAPEAVAEAAGGEQQAGEHERVGVDDPLQLAVGGVEVARRAWAGPR